MYQIDVSTAVSTQPPSTALGTPGYFTDGNAALGEAATVVPAEFLNSLMLEIMNAITGAGLELSKSSFNQLYTAIKTIAQGGASNYAADTGSANAYAATYSPTVAAPSDGMVRAFKVKTTNTGPSTFALDGSGTTFPIYGLAGSALQGGELVANGIAVIRFNSSIASNGAWVLYHSGMGAQQIAPATKSSHATQSQQVQNASHVYALDNGTATAYSASYTPAVTSLTDGMVLTFRASHANTGAATFTPNSSAIAAAPIWGGDHASLTGGEIAANGDCEVMWNSSLNGGSGAWMLLASTGGYIKTVTPPQFDSSTKVPTTAFVKESGFQFGSSAQNLTQNTTLTASAVGNLIVCTPSSAITVILPLTSDVTAGSALRLHNLSPYTVTVSRQGSSDVINCAGAALTAVTIQPGDYLDFTYLGLSGNTWEAAGTAGLQFSGAFGSLIAGNGCQKLPSGLIKQWGFSTTASSGSTPYQVTVTLPMTFPNAFFGAVTTNVGGGLSYVGVIDGPTTSAKSSLTFSSGTVGGQNFFWYALGR